MKKLFVSVVLFISVYSSTVSAAISDQVRPYIQAAFQKEFAGAQYVRWELIKGENLYHARFLYQQERVSAFFDIDGNLIATGRFVPADHLPFMAAKGVKAKYSQYNLLDVMEYSYQGEISYLVTLEDAKMRLTVQAYANGTSYIFKKEKKGKKF